MTVVENGWWWQRRMARGGISRISYKSLTLLLLLSIHSISRDWELWKDGFHLSTIVVFCKCAKRSSSMHDSILEGWSSWLQAENKLTWEALILYTLKNTVSVLFRILFFEQLFVCLNNDHEWPHVVCSCFRSNPSKRLTLHSRSLFLRNIYAASALVEWIKVKLLLRWYFLLHANIALP